MFKDVARPRRTFLERVLGKVWPLLAQLVQQARRFPEGSWCIHRNVAGPAPLEMILNLEQDTAG
jgi:hypothetical protein